jgi:hypothetical protein
VFDVQPDDLSTAGSCVTALARRHRTGSLGRVEVTGRQIDGQRDKGKHPPNFHFRSKPFLHFRNGPGRTYAGVRFGGDFVPVTVSTPKQREVLLEQVTAHVTAELASRQRKWVITF